MRRPRAGFVTPHPGGPGNPPEGTKTLCEELAGLGLVMSLVPGSADPVPVSPPSAETRNRDGAPRGARAPKTGRGTKRIRLRFTALRPLGIFAGGDSPAPCCRGRLPGPPVAGGKKVKAAYPGP